MTTTSNWRNRRRRSQAVRTALILLFCTALVVLVTWFVPALSLASQNALFRLRGAFEPPNDIVIVAIDDRSLQSIGQWPWPRAVMADAIDRLTRDRPRAIGLDVIYAEPSSPADDKELAEAIARNGHVILPVQLYETTSGSASWLGPLPQLAEAAVKIGHVHVSPDVDGMVRSIQLSKADDKGERLWAFGLEVIRRADNIAGSGIEELPGLLRFGSYRVPVRDERAASTISGVTILRQNEMMINFAGASGTFRYYSIADLLAGRIPTATFQNKIVLIGATAQSMGDSRVAPFMHYGSAPSQGGQEMPGVEIHANIVNTIRNGISVRELPDSTGFLMALLVMLASAFAISRLDGWRQIVVLGSILAAVIIGSYFAFRSYLLIPPLVPMLTGFAVVIPLLLSRSLATSRELDIKLAALAGSQKGFLAGTGESAQTGLDARLRLDLPHSLAWKLRAVDSLTARLLARMSFINRVLSSMDEAVLVTDLNGRIVFANPIAAQIFMTSEISLIGRPFVEYMIEGKLLDAQVLNQAMAGALEHRAAQLEFDIPAPEPRHYSLGLSALVADAETVGAEKPAAGQVIGVVVIVSDITKRVELDRMKTETLQLVSHELRTPLTSIHGLSDVLLKFPVPADQSREMLGTIHSEAIRLGETINRYLDLTRLESGAQALKLSPVDCRRLIAECIRNLSIFASERNIRLTQRVVPDMPELVVDYQLMTQAIGNLISNAVKYSPPGSDVTISAEHHDDGTASITVSDRGYGIPEEARDRIFDKFYRLERDTNSGVVGTGLGLPLVKEIVERHGGRISFQSSDDNGTTFIIRLPRVHPGHTLKTAG